MRMVKRSKQMQECFDHAAGPEPIHPPFWHRTRRHPAGSIDLGVDRVRARALRVPTRCLRPHATLVRGTGWGKAVAIACFIHGVLSQPEPWPVVVVDCKGGELRQTAKDLART